MVRVDNGWSTGPANSPSAALGCRQAVAQLQRTGGAVCAKIRHLNLIFCLSRVSFTIFRMCRRWFLVLAACACFLAARVDTCADASDSSRTIGLARVDITPSYPVRLSGYAARTTEYTGVVSHIYVRALAFGGQGEEPAVVLSVENCGVPGHLRNEVAQRLQKKAGLKPERFAVCSTHTHSAPWLSGYLSNLFGGPLPADQQQRVERYTKEMADAMEKAALEALADLRPGKLTHGWTKADFAANRRTPGGPVDHAVPVLFITGADGNVRGVWATYACHCTTMTSIFNVVCGDWAGFAMSELETKYPGAVALVSIGCGADSNPNPRPGEDLARGHGHGLATNVLSAWKGERRPVSGKLVCRTKEVALPYDKLPTREEWQQLAADTNAASKFTASHARMQLARLDAGQALPTSLPYLLQTWTLGKDLAFVFLPGEVVVDYSLRLKRELDTQRLWVNAYANDVPCYIPSERILKEGGYEGGLAMIYYDRPARFAPGIEDLIVRGVRDLLPAEFTAKAK